MPEWQYPKTRKQPFTFNLHGEEISDPFQWLEDGSNSKVKEWITAQNRFFVNELGEHVDTSIFEQELLEIFDSPQFSNPEVHEGKHFWVERKSDQQHPALYYQQSRDAQEQALVDPNQMDGNTTIYWWYPSPQGKYLVYGLMQGDDELAELHVLEVESGKVLETFPYAYRPKLQWLSDESGFYYNRNLPPEERPKGKERFSVRVFLHKLGDSFEDDQYIFGEDRPEEETFNLKLSPDNRFLAIRAQRDVDTTWHANDLYLYQTESKTVHVLAENRGEKYFLDFTREKLLLRTCENADNFRILQADKESWPEDVSEWSVLIPEAEDALLDFALTKGKILAVYCRNAAHLVKVFDHDGEFEFELPMPDKSSLAGLNTNRQSQEFFWGERSFLTPKQIYRFDPETEEFATFRTQENPAKPSDYQIKQAWFTSKDGTRVPMFIVHRQGLDQNAPNPTILFGYGGFSVPVTPFSLAPFLPWLKRGGIFAVANIRGGLEFGESWHRQGAMQYKQNTFDDFIAAGECLVNQNYTDSNHLGILGGSNGGLTVGAALVQRPSLFQAAVAKVPVLDMLRYHKFLVASRWINEWGDPEKPEEYAWLKQWSPYHNAKDDSEYPATLLTTAEGDTRVAPLHARKMAAKLQNANNENPVFLRTELAAGHGFGQSKTSFGLKQADILAFLAWQLGLEVD